MTEALPSWNECALTGILDFVRPYREGGPDYGLNDRVPSSTTTAPLVRMLCGSGFFATTACGARAQHPEW